MAFIDESHSTIDSKAVVITFHCWDDSLPVYILTSVNNWDPILMTKDKESSSDDNHRFQHTVVVREEVSSIHYKFRIGDSYYLHDDSAPTGRFRYGKSRNKNILTENSIRWFWRIEQYLPHLLDSQSHPLRRINTFNHAGRYRHTRKQYVHRLCQ